MTTEPHEALAIRSRRTGKVLHARIVERAPARSAATTTEAKLEVTPRAARRVSEAEAADFTAVVAVAAAAGITDKSRHRKIASQKHVQQL
jgi:hypothetical protein